MSGYPIPEGALDDRLAFIGTSGAGKTYSAGTAIEKLLASKAKVVIVDPLGVWWGLRLNANGKTRGFDLPIFGGEHGDIALNENAGKLIGETVATMAESCIVDLSGLATKSAERRFMLAFLESLYRHASGSPFHVIFDEADMWAPQKSSEPMLQSRMEEIVRRGRVRGFIPWLITQRPAVLSKDVLSQADGLVVFKLTSSQDRKAIGDWVRAQADEGQWPSIDAQLPAMKRGEAVVWLPGQSILTTAQFPAKATFDSSRAPKRGERRERRDLKPLDLAGLKDRLSSIEEEVKANDPAALKKEIARLNRELAKAEKAKAAPPPAERIVANQVDIDAAYEKGFDVGRRQGRCDAYDSVKALCEGGFPKIAAPTAPMARTEPYVPLAATPAAGITGPQQRILNALAWWKAFGIEQPSNEQVGFIAGYSPSSGGFNNLKGQLRTTGLIEYPQPGKVCLTQSGEEKADAPDVAPTRDAFHAAVRAKLSGPQIKVLDPALAAHPGSIASEEIASIAGYSASSGGFNNLRGSLRTIGLIDYPAPGQVRASDWLFP